MRFVDEVNIFVRSGAGGDGCVAFRREKYVPRGGPSGGDGGDGGSVVLVADSLKLNLIDLMYHSHYRAKRGDHGQGSDKHGRSAKDLIIHVPPGTLVKDPETEDLIADLDAEGARFVAAKGGRGGRGNSRFATSTNRAPRRADPGGPAEEKWLHLELKVIADVGIVGYPSVGKSSLIRALSNARPKVAAYPFTTLTPHLGALQVTPERQVIFADIPGLIQGAHEGLGLGHKFLRHIERTRMLVHLIDLDPSTGRDPMEDYRNINHELGAHDPALAQKQQVVAGNKIDLEGAKERGDKLREDLGELGVEMLELSAELNINTDLLLERVLEKLDLIEGGNLRKPEWEGP